MASLVQVELTRPEGNAVVHLVTWLPQTTKQGSSVKFGNYEWIAEKVYTITREA